MRLEASILDEQAKQEQLEKQILEKEWQDNHEMQTSFKELLESLEQEGKDLRDFLRRYQNAIPNEEAQLIRDIRMLLGQHGQRIHRNQTILSEGQKLSGQVESKLQKVFQDLKERDLKLLVLILNDWSISAIADLYQVQAESINKRRYRLRKKLGVKSGEDFKEFILNEIGKQDA